MKGTAKSFSTMLVILMASLGSQARAQEQEQVQVLLMSMFSIEAFEVNGVPIKNGPTGKVTVAPGDVIVAKILVRNWSPQGQRLRAYQAKIDPASYKTGTAGTVQPMGHSPGTNNDANAFIDLKDPTFVHKDVSSIPLVDSSSEGYRWLNVLIEFERSPLSKQDSKKYYCGTVKLQPSADAEGTFRISMVEEDGVSGLLDLENAPIVPQGFEPLLIEVKAGVKWLKIDSSDPPDGAVDGRIKLSSADKNNPAWKSITLQFNGDVGTATAGDFEVQDGSSSPPKITNVQVNGSQVVIKLDQGIKSGTWTTIKHKGSETFTRIGRLSGDVSNDGRSDADDLMVLIRGLNGGTNLPLYRADLDADGSVSARDALQMIDLLTQKRTAKQSRLR